MKPANNNQENILMPEDLRLRLIIAAQSVTPPAPPKLFSSCPTETLAEIRQNF